MTKIHIEVAKSALKKLENAGVRFKIVDDEVDLHETLCHEICNYGELSDYDQSQIKYAAQQAIDEGPEYAITYDIRSGRDNQDYRCYWLDSVSVVLAEDCSSDDIVTVKTLVG